VQFRWVLARWHPDERCRQCSEPPGEDAAGSASRRFAAAEVRLCYLADGTDIASAGNNFEAPAVAASGSPRQGTSQASAFVGTSAPTQKTFRSVGFAYSAQKGAYADFRFSNDVGYLPDGTPMNKAGNAVNHPENIQPDPHADGSPLPRAHFANDVGYLPDGTAMNSAGNAVNHPERMAADLHAPGSALPASEYAADVGYFVDGTPLDAAGNAAHA